MSIQNGVPWTTSSADNLTEALRDSNEREEDRELFDAGDVQTLRSDIGLENVDNTSDTQKPSSLPGTFWDPIADVIQVDSATLSLRRTHWGIREDGVPYLTDVPSDIPDDEKAVLVAPFTLRKLGDI